MGVNIIKTKSFNLALRVIEIYKTIIECNKEYVISKQFLRSGTAIGALVREAEQAESRSDFIHKLAIALKEANETDYWINLLFNSGYMERENYYAISADINEILRLLTSIIKTSKQNR